MIAMFMMIIDMAVGVKHTLSTHQPLGKWFSTIGTKRWNYLYSLDPPTSFSEYPENRAPDQHFGVFPGGPVVKNSRSHAGDAESIPGQETNISHARGN